jgi:hypothetical protein
MSSHRERERERDIQKPQQWGSLSPS